MWPFSLPVSVLILDKDFKIEYANITFCEINDVKREDVFNQPFHKFLSDDLLEKFDLSNELESVIEYGIPISHSDVKHTSPYHPDKILNITFSRIKTGEYPRIMVLIQDVTDFNQRTYQLLLLREISLSSIVCMSSQSQFCLNRPVYGLKKVPPYIIFLAYITKQRHRSGNRKRDY